MPSSSSALARKANSIDSVFQERLAKKLGLIEELRGELGTEGIKCPGVLVVGAQSAGKSSVLERLTGISFPRAENTCTRVPTIVQLQVDQALDAPVSEISTDADFASSKKCATMAELQEAILSATACSTNQECPIKDEPIHIRYRRNRGPVMTLIDLPGITHVDATNEDFDIHGVTSGMVRKYVRNENMVVLVVIPANDDFGNAEALRIAQQFDPDGARTIGVVSKCDLVPEKSDILQKICMTRASDIKLALGFIAVRNKGPGEEKSDIHTLEDELFDNHQLLRSLTDKQRGYRTLTERIVDLQSQRVDQFVPEAKKLIREKIATLRAEMEALGNGPTTPTERRLLLGTVLADVCARMTDLIRAESVPEESMNVAARTLEFSAAFGKKVTDALPDCLSSEYGDILRDLVKEASGYSLPNFMSDPIFRDQIKKQLFEGLMQNATEDLIEEVQELMLDVYQKILLSQEVNSKFPNLITTVFEEVVNVVAAAKEETAKTSRALMAAEEAQVFTVNSLYVETITEVKEMVVGAVKSANEEGGEDKFWARSPFQSRLTGIRISTAFVKECVEAFTGGDRMATLSDLQISIHCYMNIVLKRLLDILPIVVRHRLVHVVHKCLHNNIFLAMDNDAVLEGVMAEKPGIANRRAVLKSRLDSMMHAKAKLNSI